MTPPIDHDALLIAVAQGDHDAFLSLYRQEAPYMLTLGKKMLGRSTEAQDAVKDTFILIWKHAENCDTTLTSARSWMYSIFRHRTFSTLRQPGRMTPALPTLTDHLPSQPDGHLRHSHLYAALQRLDPGQRRPLLMAYYHGYTYRQIANHLGRSVEQVKRQIHQGLRAICMSGQP